MKRISQYKMIIVSVLLIAGLSSCEYKPLEEYREYNDVIIDFDWNKVESVPNAMRVAFYPLDETGKKNMSKGYTFYDLPKSIWPASIQIPIGLYDVVAWNNDTEHVICDKYNSQQTLYATTPEYQPRGTFDTRTVLDSIYNGQKVLDYPDYMVHAIEREIPVSIGNTQKITLTPDSMVITINYKLHGVGGLSWVKQIRGAVNNVAGKRYIAQDNATSDDVAIMFDCQYNAEDSLIYGSFYVFGIEPTDMRNLSHKMVFFFWMDAGKIFIPIDVTKIFQECSLNNKEINIEIPSLQIDLRDYISSKSTFDVNIDEWDDLNIDIGF